MSHSPSMLTLVPGAIVVAFYTTEGIAAARLLAIGLLIDALFPSTVFVMLFAGAAISTSISAARSRLVYKFDFFSMFGVLQAVLSYVATCALVALKNAKKPGILSYFSTCGVLSVSLTLSLGYATLFFFRQSAPLFASVAIASGRITWELLINQCKDYYDNERFGPGIGVERTNQGGLQL